MDLGISGKNALVTGGSRGLGRQTALSLAGEGVNVAICGRTQSTLDKTVRELEALGVKAIGIEADVSNVEGMDDLHQQVTTGLGEVDILVNNAGGTRSRDDITGTSLEDFKATFDLNLFGGFQLMKAVIPHMQEQGWGRIINIASIWGRESGGNISYMSSKAALIGATKHTAHALAKDGILVNSVCPGPVYSDSWDRNVERLAEERGITVDKCRVAVDREEAAKIPLKRIGEGRDVAGLVVFLASDEASWITGSCFHVDGGKNRSIL
ncbi:MAG: SDR family oxidoreductase [Chloroflexi bacterium]|nr:SDR family oxidoreductase [Chloroflexota bacterium]